MKWITAVVRDRRKKRKNQDKGVVAVLTPESEYERLIIESLIEKIPDHPLTKEPKGLYCAGSTKCLSLFLNFD